MYNLSILIDKRNIIFFCFIFLVVEKIFFEFIVCLKSNERCWVIFDDVFGEDFYVKFFIFRDIYKIKYFVIKVISKCLIF